MGFGLGPTRTGFANQSEWDQEDFARAAREDASLANACRLGCQSLRLWRRPQNRKEMIRLSLSLSLKRPLSDFKP